MLGVSLPSISRFFRRMSSSARSRSADSRVSRSALGFELALGFGKLLEEDVRPDWVPRRGGRGAREERVESAGRGASWELMDVSGSCADLRAMSRILRAARCARVADEGQ